MTCRLFGPVLILFLAAASEATASSEDQPAKPSQAVADQPFDLGQDVRDAERELKIAEEAFGPDDHRVAPRLQDLAQMYSLQGRLAEAEPLLRRALAIAEGLSPYLHDVANALFGFDEDVARWYFQKMGEETSGETTDQASAGSNEPHVAAILENLALLYHTQGRSAEAEPLFKRALGIYEQSLGPTHAAVATVLEHYGACLRSLDRVSEAEAMDTRAKGLRAGQP